jgi:hypothetical protein
MERFAAPSLESCKRQLFESNQMEDMDDFDDDDPPQPVQPSGVVPARIDACFRYLFFTLDLRNSGLPDMHGKELATYNSALTCLNLYFAGETDHGDHPPKRDQLDYIEPTDDDLRQIEDEDA